jgi:hypothetical protein
MSSAAAPVLPVPDLDTIRLIAALSDHSNHEYHVMAMQACDRALATNYTATCLQWLCLTYHADRKGSFMNDNPAIHQLVHNTNQWDHLGQLAALLLKNALLRPPPVSSDGNATTTNGVIAPEHGETFRQGLLALVLSCDESSALQRVIATLVATAAVNCRGRQPALHMNVAWPDLFGRLVAHQPTTTPILRTILHILQDGIDAVSDLDLDGAVVSWLNVAANGNSEIVVVSDLVLECLACCIPRLPSALRAHWSDYLQLLSQASTYHPDTVCRSLVTIVTERSELLDQSVLPFLLRATAAGSLDACDFWLSFATLDQDQMSIGLYECIEGSVLQQLIPILLQKMVYSSEQQAEVLASIDDDDKDEDERPIFHKQKAHGMVADHYDPNDDDNDDDDDDFDTDWNLRKCAAASLDSLAQLYGPERILPFLLPPVESVLHSGDVWSQEAALLAIGAIAEGCYDEMVPFLEKGLFRLLLDLLNSATPLPPLHSIAAWTLSQYAPWVVTNADHLRLVLDTLLNRTQQGPTVVQAACVAALGVVVEHAGAQIAAHTRVYEVLAHALAVRSRRVLLNVLDVYGTLAEAGPGQPMLLLGVPKIMELWNAVASRDPRTMLLLPLLESLAAIAISLRQQFEPFALSSLENALCMIETLRLMMLPEDDYSETDLDPIVCAIDLLDGLVEAFEDSFASLVQSSGTYGPLFGNVVVSLVENDGPSVRTSAWALVGDLARHAPTLLNIGSIVPQCAINIDQQHPYLTTNTVWAFGEICVVLRKTNDASALVAHMPAIVQSLIALLAGNGAESGGIPGLAENAASCMGRIALLDPSLCAADAPRFLLGWCDGLGKIEDPFERRDGFMGFIKIVYSNPQAVSQSAADVKDALVSILFALVTWHLSAEQKQDPSLWTKSDVIFQPLPEDDPELVAALSKLVADLKNFVGEDSWDVVLRRLPVNVRRLLREVYRT